MEKGRIGESYHICGEFYRTYDAYKLASEVSSKRAPRGVSPKMIRAMSIMVKPIEFLMPEEYTSEYLRIIAGVTYIGDNSKAKRELGYNPRPVSEGWVETVRYEMKLLGM